MPTLSEQVSSVVTTLEDASTKAQAIVETDSVINTEAGQRDSLPMVLRKAKEALKDLGPYLIGTFEIGGVTVTNSTQVVRLAATDDDYRWDGGYPKDVIAGTVAENGGEGVGKWVNIGAVTLRKEVRDGQYIVACRLAAEAGLNMVGRFENDCTVTTTSDVVWNYRDNKYYSYAGGLPHSVLSLFNPIGSAGWIDMTHLTFRGEIHDLNDVISQRPTFNAIPRLLSAFASYNEATDPEITIVGLGSSVGNGASLPDPATQAPVKYLASKLKSCLDVGNIFNIQSYNYSVNGSTISEYLTPFNQAISDGHAPKLLVLAYGMNDSGVDIFNAGQTYPAIATNLRNIIIKARDLGSDVVVMTTPHHKCSAVTYSLNPANPQYYPTYIAAPVGAEAMTPPASKSSISGDFTNSGKSITISHRHMRVNQMFRKIAAEFGVPVIDAEYFWFKALEKYGESALFNAGEVLHPNLLGHQQSYQAAIDMFIEGLQRQASQSVDLQLSGNVGVNKLTPAAVVDIEVPYTTTPKPSLSVRARTGTPDGAGVKASGVVWAVDPDSGDLVGYAVSKTDASSIEFYRISATVPGGSVIAPVQISRKFYGGEIKSVSSGGFNISAQTKMIDVPANSAGKIKIHSYNSGIGRKYYECLFICKNSAITLGTPNVVGDNVFSVTSSGTALLFAPVAVNTNVNWDIEISSGI